MLISYPNDKAKVDNNSLYYLQQKLFEGWKDIKCSSDLEELKKDKEKLESPYQQKDITYQIIQRVDTVIVAANPVYPSD